mgnify:CR=1 FL=1
MFIHTVTPSETLYHIARKYGVAPTKIIEANGLENPDRLSVGDKLVIITPTRTYTVRGGDTLEKISRRFGIPIKEILKNNPSLMGGDKIYPEELLTLKQDAPRHGSALINGTPPMDPQEIRKTRTLTRGKCSEIASVSSLPDPELWFETLLERQRKESK